MIADDDCGVAYKPQKVIVRVFQSLNNCCLSVRKLKILWQDWGSLNDRRPGLMVLEAKMKSTNKFLLPIASSTSAGKHWVSGNIPVSSFWLANTSHSKDDYRCDRDMSVLIKFNGRILKWDIEWKRPSKGCSSFKNWSCSTWHWSCWQSSAQPSLSLSCVQVWLGDQIRHQQNKKSSLDSTEDYWCLPVQPPGKKQGQVPSTQTHYCPQSIWTDAGWLPAHSPGIIDLGTASSHKLLHFKEVHLF